MKLPVTGWCASDGKLTGGCCSEMSDPIAFPVSHQIKMTNNYNLLMIIAPSLGFVLLALLLAYFLRGKEGRTRWDEALQSFGNSRGILEWMDSASCLFSPFLRVPLLSLPSSSLSRRLEVNSFSPRC